MEIGERIKKRREELGMSQEELAQKAGYKSRSSINKIEIDGRGLPQSKIVNIANALDTTPAYIMGWEENYYLGENLQRIFRILSKEFEISENELIRCFFAEDFDALLPSKKFITLDNMRCALKEYLANHVLDKNISLNSKENNHLKKYRALDMHGQELIDTILDKEYERCIAT
ncbi:helix-turn-helix domain-containing protein, partial [Enterocloster citroniae]